MRGFDQIVDKLVNLLFQGFYFYDGKVKACTLYSNIADEYFKGRFCEEKDPKDRQYSYTFAGRKCKYDCQ